MNELTVVLPAYNEEENICKMVSRWEEHQERLLKDYQLNLFIVAVDDGSKDQTSQLCDKLKKTYDNFTVVHHQVNKGLGEAIKTGIQYALEERPDNKYICIMDCDNTQDPNYIESMLDQHKKSKADVVIASRYQEGAAVEGLSKMRQLTSEGAKVVYKMLFHVKNVRDYTCGYRLYTHEILEKGRLTFKEQLIEERGFTCMAELLYKLYLCGGTFAEVPFRLRYDFKQGASKMKVVQTSIGSIKLTFRLRRQKKELNS